MMSISKMRAEAWKILRGKWFLRLLIAGVLLQIIAGSVNLAIKHALKSVSITLAGDFVTEQVKAMSQGISYSLPTMKAYGWMIGGACLQMFVAYVFGAIVVFGFMGILLKARDQDESRWLASSLSGFARPLDVAWLMALMNILVMLVMLACAVPLAGVSALLISHFGYEINSAAGIAALVLSVGLSALCSVPLIYAYRQAWFIKNEDPSLSACECLRRSRRLMKGHKMSAFLLDLSYTGWIILVLLLLGTQALFAVGKSFGAMSAAISFAVSFLAFYALLKVMFSMLLSRAVFYRELQQSAAENTANA
ncbi:MAG: DUF975 family protein [Kiritimatiellae bacterium]|nr:DUF975 family protein [Kiritimatiellia bacterium]